MVLGVQKWEKQAWLLLSCYLHSSADEDQYQGRPPGKHIISRGHSEKNSVLGKGTTWGPTGDGGQRRPLWGGSTGLRPAVSQAVRQVQEGEEENMPGSGEQRVHRPEPERSLAACGLTVLASRGGGGQGGHCWGRRGPGHAWINVSLGTDWLAALGQFCQLDFGHGTIDKVELKQMSFLASASILLKPNYPEDRW